MTVQMFLMLLKWRKWMKWIPDLWQHQQEALDRVNSLWDAGRPGALLAMGCGTGKSRVAVELIEDANLFPALILAPRSVIWAPKGEESAWQKQFRLYARRQYDVLCLADGSTAKRAKALQASAARGTPFVAVINYDAAWRGELREAIMRIQWRVIVGDEGHRLQAAGGRQSWFAKELAKRVPYRLGLTGTPLATGPLGAYGLFRFLDPSVFSINNKPMNFAQFRNRFAVMGGYGNHQVLSYTRLDELSERMNSISYRATAEVLNLLPPTTETLFCELEPEARRVYRGIEDDFIAELSTGEITVQNALVKMLRLAQIASGTIETDEGVTVNISKAKENLLRDTLEGIGAEEPIVVFCRFRADLDRVHLAAERLGRGSLELSGRRNELARWQRDDAALILAVQVQAGGVGIDLTRARYCLFYSLGFSLAEFEQAKARLQRPGQQQEHPVTFIQLVAAQTVDSRLYKALEQKGDIVRSILDGMRPPP